MKASRQTKRALIPSILAVILCVAMLVGTTFAWFTDTASTSVNKIQAGTLDVKLYQGNASTGTNVTEWTEITSDTGTNLQFMKATGGANQEVLWEPGCTYRLPALKIENNGNLALKYKLVITGIDGDAELNNAIDWTIEDSSTAKDTTKPLSEAEYSLAAKTTTATDSDILTIQGHMKEDAGNEYQGLSIDGISIMVVAAQDTVEYDSTGNQYDENVPTITVSTEQELRTALYNNPYVKIVLQDDINLSMKYDAGTSGLNDSGTGDTLSNYKESTDNRAARLVVKAGQYVILDLNGHTIARGQSATHGSWSRTDTDLIGNFGTLTVTDSSTGTAGTLTGSGFYNCGGAVLHNYGENAVLTVEKITVNGNAAGMTNNSKSTGQNTIINGDAGSTNSANVTTEPAYAGGTVIIDGATVTDTGDDITACLVKNVSGTMIIKGSASLSSTTKALSCDGGTVYVKSGTIAGGTTNGYAIKAAVESPATGAVVVVTDANVTITGSQTTENGGKITHK